MENPEDRCENCREYYASEEVDARVAELEAERDAARKERNEYFAERNRACERASALMVERDALQSELSDCKDDLAAKEGDGDE